MHAVFFVQLFLSINILINGTENVQPVVAVAAFPSIPMEWRKFSKRHPRR
jgi:hypothetical protein